MNVSAKELFRQGIPWGAQYYRAPTPPAADWERDLAAMRQAGFNTIKYWPQWRWNHPAPGEFWFDDLDRLMDLAAANNLRVILNVIFDVAPAWFFRQHPESRMVHLGGRIMEPTTLPHRQIGGAPGPCLHHPEGRRQREAFLDAVVKRYAAHAAMWIWDTWNEPELSCGLVRNCAPLDTICACPSSRAEFVIWLQRKYGTLDALNQAWGRNYRAWEEWEHPQQPDTYADWIDWRLFFRDTVVAEQRWRADLVRRLDSTHPVMCHTVPPPYFDITACGSDDFALADLGDLHGASCGYAPVTSDFTRSAAAGKPVLGSEVHALPGSTFHRPIPLSARTLDRHVFVPLFRGFKGFVFWQYRAELLGKEAPAWGMTRPDGSPEPWLEHCRGMAAFLAEHREFLLAAEPDPAPVGILVAPENEVFFYCFDQNLNRYWDGVLGAHQLLEDSGFPVDFVSSDRLAEGRANHYQALFLPVPFALPHRAAQALSSYVEQGGCLVSEGFLCAHDPSTGMASTTNPGHGLHEVFGCREIGVTPLNAPGADLTLALDGPMGELAAGTRVAAGGLGAQRLEPTTGAARAAWAAGGAAVVENRYGQGRAALVGTWLSSRYRAEPDAAARGLVEALLGVPRPEFWSGEARVDRLRHHDRTWVLVQPLRDQAATATVRVPANVKALREVRGGRRLAARQGRVKVEVPGDGVVLLEVEAG